MKIIFFCENANQVHISHSIANSIYFPSDVSVEVALLDWDSETAAWVSATVAALSWNVAVVNMIDGDPRFREAFRTAKAKDGILKDIVFAYLRNYLAQGDARLLQFNDRSVRGRAVAAVCRNTGLRRMLVQDGFLNFTSKTANLEKTDQNYGWGSSNPERIAVWGRAMAEALKERHHVNDRNIHIVGVTKPSMVLPDHVSHRPVEGDIKVLWADQAILDQRKAQKEAWLSEFGDIASQLGNFKTDLRLHPSTKEQTRVLLEESTGGAFTAQVPLKPQMSQEELRSYDVVVTYYSTVFLDCLVSNIPCVLYKTKSLDIELPTIDHPLLVYCSEVDALADAVRQAASISVNADTPPMIFDYVQPEDGTENIAKIISSALPSTAWDGANSVRSYGLDVLENARRLQRGTILVLSTSFGDHIGVGKPIKAFYEYAKDLGLDFDFHLVANGDVNVLLSKVSQSSMVLINGFDVVKTLSQVDMRAVAAASETRGVPLIFYCHETQFVYRRLLDSFGGRVQAFTDKVLPKCHVFAVSDQQADWIASLGAKNIRTVYNAVGAAFKPVELERSEKAIVLMVGTQQKRKGVELFSNVADLAKSQGLDWQFVWLGAYTKDSGGLYRSPEVDWHGHVGTDEVRSWLSKSSVFFLSSIDDPMPLGVGEALATGLPCVVFKSTGFAQFIDHHAAGAVYPYYDAHTALSSLKRILVENHFVPVSPDAVMSVVGLEAFGRRMVVAMGEILIGSSPSSRFTPTLASPITIHRLNKSVTPKANRTKPSGFIRFLDAIERTAPGVLVRPGKRVLKSLGVIGRG